MMTLRPTSKTGTTACRPSSSGSAWPHSVPNGVHTHLLGPRHPSFINLTHSLSATDRCDPYVAVYTPPEPSRVAELTTMRWRGLIPPSFVQALLDAVL